MKDVGERAFVLDGNRQEADGRLLGKARGFKHRSAGQGGSQRGPTQGNVAPAYVRRLNRDRSRRAKDLIKHRKLGELVHQIVEPDERSNTALFQRLQRHRSRLFKGAIHLILQPPCQDHIKSSCEDRQDHTQRNAVP